MAPYQKPTVEEVEDEYRRKRQDNGVRVHLRELGIASTATQARRWRKRKCPWESTQQLRKTAALAT